MIPHLAATYILKVFGEYFVIAHGDFNKSQWIGENKDTLEDLGMELHGISSASKPVASWLSRDVLQECREACAGHGYLRGTKI